MVTYRRVADLPGYCLIITGRCSKTYLMYPFRGLLGGPLGWEVRHFTGLMYVAGRTLVHLQRAHIHMLTET